jgi:putative PIN family toxin of toxin-antitoxin system
MQGAVQLFVTREILAEYREVLKRPAFGFEVATIETFLSELENAAVTVYPTTRVTSALDEADNRFLECAEEARAQFVVTGNKKELSLCGIWECKDCQPGRVRRAADLGVRLPQVRMRVAQYLWQFLPTWNKYRICRSGESCASCIRLIGVRSAGASALSVQAASAKAVAGRMAPQCAACQMGGGSIRRKTPGGTAAGAALAGPTWKKWCDFERHGWSLLPRTLIIIRPTTDCATYVVFVSAAT